MQVRVCVCVYIYMYMCVCVCAGACVRVLSSCDHPGRAWVFDTRGQSLGCCVVPRWLRSMHVFLIAMSPDKDSADQEVI